MRALFRCAVVAVAAAARRARRRDLGTSPPTNSPPIHRLPRDRIDVIPVSIDDSFTPVADANLTAACAVVLCFGATPNKNLGRDRRRTAAGCTIASARRGSMSTTPSKARLDASGMSCGRTGAGLTDDELRQWYADVRRGGVPVDLRGLRDADRRSASRWSARGHERSRADERGRGGSGLSGRPGRPGVDPRRRRARAGRRRVPRRVWSPRVTPTASASDPKSRRARTPRFTARWRTRDSSDERFVGGWGLADRWSWTPRSRASEGVTCGGRRRWRG